MDAALLLSLFPTDAGIRIAAVNATSGLVSAELVPTGDGTTCPRRGSVTTAVHGRYHRTLHDRPCLGVPVSFAITARKRVCRRADC